MDKEKKIRVGISVGDLNGIGLEVVLKTFSDKRMLDFCTPVIFASTKVVSYHKKANGINLPIHGAQSLDAVLEGKVNLINVWKEDVSMDLGKVSDVSGKYAFLSLEAATLALKEGKVDFLLTAPISKENIQSEEFNFAGHTEYLESKLEGDSLMILMTDSLRLGLVTGHVPVSEVSQTITKELILKKVDIMHDTLIKDFGIRKPKIAVLGLNPHCGDNGVIGKEDGELIAPTVDEIYNSGKMVFGPYSADGFFGARNYENFDGVLAMYHDQGLVAFKTIAFGNGVNFTAGLSGIRTSPDHGTAFEIAGKGMADVSSFKEALYTGIKVFKERKSYLDLTKNPLKSKKN